MKFNVDLFVLVVAFSVFLGSSQADGEVTFYHLDCNETNELNSTPAVLDSKAASTLSTTRDSRAFAFANIVIATGIVGTIANGVILVTMFKSKQISTKDTKYLILNQLVLDLLSCVLVVITYSLKVLDITYKDGVGFRFVCSFLASELLLFVSMLNSTNSLVAIAIERYLKIVRWSCSKHNYKPWMTRVMIIIPLIGFLGWPSSLQLKFLLRESSETSASPWLSGRTSGLDKCLCSSCVCYRSWFHIRLWFICIGRFWDLFAWECRYDPGRTKLGIRQSRFENK